MTTAQSPLNLLQTQARKMAVALKAAERGEKIASDPFGKIAAARARPSIKFVVVMDDKVLAMEIPWQVVRETSEDGLVEWIVGQMRESKETVQ
jgi:hypothetical protein